MKTDLKMTFKNYFSGGFRKCYTNNLIVINCNEL